MTLRPSSRQHRQHRERRDESVAAQLGPTSAQAFTLLIGKGAEALVAERPVVGSIFAADVRAGQGRQAATDWICSFAARTADTAPCDKIDDAVGSLKRDGTDRKIAVTWLGEC